MVLFYALVLMLFTKFSAIAPLDQGAIPTFKKKSYDGKVDQI